MTNKGEEAMEIKNQTRLQKFYLNIILTCNVYTIKVTLWRGVWYRAPSDIHIDPPSVFQANARQFRVSRNLTVDQTNVTGGLFQAPLLACGQPPPWGEGLAVHRLASLPLGETFHKRLKYSNSQLLMSRSHSMPYYLESWPSFKGICELS